MSEATSFWEGVVSEREPEPESNIDAALCKYCNRNDAWTFARKHIRGTYFEWLPIEIIEMIFEHLRQLINRNEIEFFEWYFSSEQTDTPTLKTVRASKEDIRKKKEGVSMPSIKCIADENGNDMWIKEIKPRNTSNQCMLDWSSTINFGVKNYEGMKKMLNNLIKWYVWVVDHSYKTSWYNFAVCVIRKIPELDYQLKDYENGINPLPDRLKVEGELERMREELDSIYFFIFRYIPYVILSRSVNYYTQAKTLGIRYKDIMYKIYTNSGLDEYEFMDFNIQEIEEFEMKLYAPDYFYNVYQKYTKLRNGKVLIPIGERPAFYWLGNTYVRRFD